MDSQEREFAKGHHKNPVISCWTPVGLFYYIWRNWREKHLCKYSSTLQFFFFFLPYLFSFSHSFSLSHCIFFNRGRRRSEARASAAPQLGWRCTVVRRGRGLLRLPVAQDVPPHARAPLTGRADVWEHLMMPPECCHRRGNDAKMRRRLPWR